MHEQNKFTETSENPIKDFNDNYNNIKNIQNSNEENKIQNNQNIFTPNNNTNQNVKQEPKLNTKNKKNKSKKSTNIKSNHAILDNNELKPKNSNTNSEHQDLISEIAHNDTESAETLIPLINDDKKNIKITNNR